MLALIGRATISNMSVASSLEKFEHSCSTSGRRKAAAVRSAAEFGLKIRISISFESTEHTVHQHQRRCFSTSTAGGNTWAMENGFPLMFIRKNRTSDI